MQLFTPIMYSNDPLELRCRLCLFSSGYIKSVGNHLPMERTCNSLVWRVLPGWQLNRPIVQQRWDCHFFDFWSVHIRCVQIVLDIDCRAWRCTFGIFYKHRCILSTSWLCRVWLGEFSRPTAWQPLPRVSGNQNVSLFCEKNEEFSAFR